MNIADFAKQFLFYFTFFLLFKISDAYEESNHSIVKRSTLNKIKIHENATKTEDLNSLKYNESALNHTTTHMTDFEVNDLTKHIHLSQTPPMIPVTDSSNNNNKDDIKYNIDHISGNSAIIHSNGRFNLATGTIAAVTCLTIAVTAYIGIVLWKNYVQKNYEAREILLNEDDIGDINDEDMRHFEAACIQIEA